MIHLSSLFCLPRTVTQPRAHTPVLLATLVSEPAFYKKKHKKTSLPKSVSLLLLTTPKNIFHLPRTVTQPRAHTPVLLATLVSEPAFYATSLLFLLHR